jgi:hypothetical protein
MKKVGFLFLFFIYAKSLELSKNSSSVPVQFDTTLCNFEATTSVPTFLPKGFMNYFDHSYPLGNNISTTDWLDSASLKRLDFLPFIPTPVQVDVAT